MRFFLTRSLYLCQFLYTLAVNGLQFLQLLKGQYRRKIFHVANLMSAVAKYLSVSYVLFLLVIFQ